MHLGAPGHQASRVREGLLVAWLDSIKSSAKCIYLLGDIFDFWFEYKKVVPKGYVRLLGKLAELTDKGVEIIIFRGNHDLWFKDYFQQELNIPVYPEPVIKTFGTKTFYIAHGDGLGPSDRGYKLLKKVFLFPFNQWLFRWFHPDLGIGLANFFSAKSRGYNINNPTPFLGEKEWLVRHARDILKTQKIDFFIFGHRHVATEMQLDEHATYINLGDWITNFTFGVFDGTNFKLEKYSR